MFDGAVTNFYRFQFVKRSDTMSNCILSFPNYALINYSEREISLNMYVHNLK